MRWVSELRRGWRQLAAIALLVGVGGGVAIGAAAGGRRTDTAIPRFIAYSRVEDGGAFTGSPTALAKVLALPQVVASGRRPYLFVSADRAGTDVGSLNAFAVADPALLRDFDRPLVVAGRLPDYRRSGEAVVNAFAAARRHLRVGSRLRLYAFSAPQVISAGSSGFGQFAAPQGPVYDVTVVGVIRQPTDVNAIENTAAAKDVIYEGQENVYLTPAFLHRYAADLGFPYDAVPGMEGGAVRLRHGGSDFPAFAAAARRVAGDGVQLQVGSDFATAALHAQRGVHVQAVALYLFAGLAGLATLLIAGQALARRAYLDAADNPALWSMGMTRAGLLALAALRAGVVAGAGAATAVLIAWLSSPLMPIGIAREAEVNPGLSANAALLAGGAAAALVLVAARLLLPAWRLTGPGRLRGPAAAPGGRHRSRVAEAASRGGLPVPAVTGIRIAFEHGTGPAAVPTWTTLVGSIAALAGLTGALTFGASLGHLVDRPAAQGWNWDVIVGNPNSQGDQQAAIVPGLRRDAAVAGVSGLAGGTGTVNGTSVPALAVERLKGGVHPPVLAGRAPQAADEVALGGQTLARIHRRIGDTVTLGQGVRQVRARVVGQVLMPSAGDVFTFGLADGAVVTLDGARRLVPDLPVSMFAVRYTSGVDTAAETAHLKREFGRVVLSQLPPEDVDNLQRVSGLPLALAGLVALLGTATLAHTLVTAVRRRRRDLAVLKTLGFTRRQVAATVAWQGTSFALASLVIGVPVGVAAGRWAWHAVADQIGAAAPAVVPMALIAVSVPAALVLAGAVAAGPAWLAARLPAAVALRTE